MTALIAAGAALLGTIVGASVTMWVATYAQRHQDRREKRQRVHASFRRVLLAANGLAAMTAPYQPAGGGAWNEQEMPEEDRNRYYQALDGLYEELRNATVDLTLEGIAEPVAAVKELVKNFDDFRWHQRRTRRRGATEEDWRVPPEAAQAIAAIRDRLEDQLPTILNDILPVRPPRPWLPGSTGAD